MSNKVNRLAGTALLIVLSVIFVLNMAAPAYAAGSPSLPPVDGSSSLPPVNDGAAVAWGDSWNNILRLVYGIMLGAGALSVAVGGVMMLLGFLFHGDEKDQRKTFDQGKRVAIYAGLTVAALLLLPLIVKGAVSLFKQFEWTPPAPQPPNTSNTPTPIPQSVIAPRSIVPAIMMRR